MNFKKSLIVLVGFFILFGFFVGAEIINQKGDLMGEVSIEKGWNLIAGLDDRKIDSDSEIGLSDIKVIWSYSPFQKKYLRVYPNPEEIVEEGTDEDYPFTSSMWVYSEKKGKLKYRLNDDDPFIEGRDLFSGWNFITIAPEIIGKSLQEIKGTCIIESSDDVQFWLAESQEWDSKSGFLDFSFESNSLEGKGMVIKVPSDCNLGTTSSGDEIGVPSLPDDEEWQYDFEINDLDNFGSSAKAGSSFNIEIETSESDGSYPEDSEGITTQLYLFRKEPRETVFGGNPEYLGGGRWRMEGTYPSEIGEYELLVSLYCGDYEEICYERYGGHNQKDLSLDLTLN